MASPTAEMDETEAHSAMRELVRLSDGDGVHSYLTDRFATSAREPSQGMEVRFEAGMEVRFEAGGGGSDPVLTFSPPMPAWEPSKV